jgi:Ca2+-transporting ATPase
MSESFFKSIEQISRELDVDLKTGISSEEAQRRLAEHGENKLQGKKEKTIFQKLLLQFNDFLVLILIAAAAVSIAMGEVIDGSVIIAIVILNAILGVVQENRAGNALKALKEMSSPQAKVLRGGQIVKAASNLIVPGDVVALEAGDYIPADLRLSDSVNLKIDESALTGESVPSEKDAKAELEEGTELGDRVNSAYMGTLVTYGRGHGIVVATGMKSQMGKIAAMLAETDEELTPLQKALNSLGKTLGIVCLAVCFSIFLLGIWRERSALQSGWAFFRSEATLEMFMTAVSLAVAAIPEGLTMVVTVILALGMQKMTKSNAIIKRLSAVETLGSTTVICSDKTGTLTQNKMTVVSLYADEKLYEATGSGYQAEGEVFEKGAGGAPLGPGVKRLCEGAALCNDAIYNSAEGKIIGDPTEGALLVIAAKIGFYREALEKEKPRVDELPFDSDRKLMSTVHPFETGCIMYTKGAPDEILRKCAHIYKNGEILDLSEKDRENITEQNSAFAKNALRVLGVAFKFMAEGGEPEESDLVFAGLAGMIDPPRDEAKDAIKVCKKAGIIVKMITGDHKATAVAIAKQLDITQDGRALDGREINELSDEELKVAANDTHVFARVSPEHKVRLVSAVRGNDNIVAMTGDGVNDAPSLKKADIGVAMGITGTDVSKEASDMILTDDNFASIVRAVEEGRTIYNNIRKVVCYLLSCNIGEILVIFVALLAGYPVPLLPIQLLAINLITDAFPAFALGMEEKEAGIMDQPPRDPKRPIIDKKMNISVSIQSIALCIGALGSFIFALRFFGEETAKTACFFTLAIGELLRAYTARSEKTSIFKMRWFSNKYLNQCVIVSILFLIASVYAPFINTSIFGNYPLVPIELLAAFLFAIVPMLGGEMSKLFIK